MVSNLPLIPTSHEHKHMRGSFQFEGCTYKVAKLSGRYTDECCAIFARCLGQAIRALAAEGR